MSPIFFNLLMETLFREFRSEPRIKLYIFADDILILLSGKDIKTTHSILQNALNKIVNWAKGHKLNFTAKKCKSMLFTRNRSLKEPQNLKIGGFEIEWVKKYKYLGIIIDKHLDWNDQLEGIQDNAIKTLFQLKKAVGVKYGPSPKVLKLIYEQIILPKLGHASFAWYTKLNSQKAEKIFRRISKIMCAYICNTYKSMNITTKEVILGLKYYLQNKALSTAARLKSCNDWTNTQGSIEKNA